MDSTNNRKLETLIYAGLWTLAVVLFLLDVIRARSYTDMPLIDTYAVAKIAVKLLPFMVLFVLNNYLLIPRMLKRGRYGAYLFIVVLSVAVIWLWQRFQFYDFIASGDGAEFHEPPHPGPQPIIPLPLFLDVIYDLLIVGVNLTISLIVRLSVNIYYMVQALNRVVRLQ